MTETIISMELPAGGHLAIRRNRIRPEGEERNLSRISLVSGIHGDELVLLFIFFLVFIIDERDGVFSLMIFLIIFLLNYYD